MSEYSSKISEQSENLDSFSIVENVDDLEVASPYVAEVPQTLTKEPTGIRNTVETDMEMNGPIIEKRSSFKEAQGSKIQLTWNRISILSQKKKRMCSRNDQCADTITVLDNLSGTVLPGQILTIIGASGAGKTTLLNYLSGRDPSTNLEKHGEVYVNGKDRNKVDFSGISAYVQQDDVLFQTMTVRECIDFAAKMKLPPTTNYQMIVDDLIESLGLQKASNTRIGGSLVRGVSGGERKRTSIGVELITNPNLIFLDEPTTGLDSYTAQNVFRLLKELATSGRTVVLTIHQPSSEIFEMFDQLMLMACGKVIYMNSAHKAINYFKSIGYSCPEQTNPADYFMELMSIESIHDVDSDDKEDVKKRITLLEESYIEKISYLSQKYEDSELKCDCENQNLYCQNDKLANKKIYSPNFCKQLMLLLQRSFLGSVRISISSYVQTMVYLIISITAVLAYGQLGSDIQSIQNRNGLLYFIVCVIMMNAYQGVILIFPDERIVFLKEYKSKMYSLTAYFIATIASQIPLNMLNVTITSVIVYFCTNLNMKDADHFFIFYSYSILLIFAGSALGYCGGVIARSRDEGLNTLPLVIIPMILLSGFFVNDSNIIFFVRPLKYITVFKWGYQVYALNEYNGLMLDCSPKCNSVSEFGFDGDITDSAMWSIGMFCFYHILAYGLFVIVAKLNK